MLSRCLLVLLALVAAGGCGRERSVTDELRRAIASYREGGERPTEAQVDALFARLDAEIAQLRADAAGMDGAARQEVEQRREALERERATLGRAWVEAKVERLRGAAESAVRGMGEEVGRTLEEAGRRIRESMQQGAGAAPPGTAAR